MAAALGITWKGVGSVGEQLALALGKPLWGAGLDAAVGEEGTALPAHPVREPANPTCCCERRSTCAHARLPLPPAPCRRYRLRFGVRQHARAVGG